MSRPVRVLAVVPVLAVLIAASALLHAPARSGDGVPYPEGWRTWAHVKSMAILGEEHPLFGAFGGIHHVYVNRVGLSAARRGGEYPDGSVIVFDLFAANSGSGAVQEGDRKFIGVMRKDRRRWPDTGGWGFEAFAGGDRARRVVKDARQECFECHTAVRDRDHVYSSWRD